MEKNGRPRGEEEEKRKERRIRIKWDEEARRIYKETANRISLPKGGKEDTTEQKWKN